MKLNVMLIGIMMAFAIVSASGGYLVEPLTYTALSASTYRVATQPGDVACAKNSSGDFMYKNAKLIEISTAVFPGMEVGGHTDMGGPGDVLSGDYYFTTVLFDPIGLTSNIISTFKPVGIANLASTSLNGNYFQSTNTAQWTPRVFWKLPERDCWNWNYLTYNQTGNVYANVIGVPSVNANSIRKAGVWFSRYAHPGLKSGIQTIFFSEYAGDMRPGTEAWVTVGVPFIANNPSYPTIRFKQNNNSTPIIYYRGVKTSPNFVSYEPVFVTERGSRWPSVETTRVIAQISTSNVADPSFRFTTATQPVGFSDWPEYGVGTHITDTLDRTPQNRQNTLSEDEYASMLSSLDTNGNVASPLRAVAEGTTIAKNLFMIGSEYAPFKTWKISVNLEEDYYEKQTYWIGTSPSAVAYDAGMRDVIVNKYSAMASSVKFEGNDFGIPVCAGYLYDLMPGDWTSCTNDMNIERFGGMGLIERHRMKIQFLNKEWIISEIVAPTAPLASSTAAINGGQIKLAKEAKYGGLNAGERFTNSPLSIRLVGIAMTATCIYDEHAAIYDILNTNSEVIGQIQNCPGKTYTFSQNGTNNTVKIHTYHTEPNLVVLGGRATTAIYSDEIVLKDNARYNLVSSQDPDKNFKVSLLWKNRDYNNGSSSTVVDSLREIVVYTTEFSDKTLPGGAFNFLSSQPAFTVTYEGLTPCSLFKEDKPYDVEYC